MNTKKDKLKIIMIDAKENVDIFNYLIEKNKYELYSLTKNNVLEIYDIILSCDVLIIGIIKSININEALNVIDEFISKGKDIIAIKLSNKDSKEYREKYISHFLIQNGCMYV